MLHFRVQVRRELIEKGGLGVKGYFYLCFLGLNYQEGTYQELAF